MLLYLEDDKSFKTEGNMLVFCQVDEERKEQEQYAHYRKRQRCVFRIMLLKCRHGVCHCCDIVVKC